MMGGQAGEGAPETLVLADLKAEWDGRFVRVDAQVQQLAERGVLPPAVGALYKAALDAAPQSGDLAAVSAWVDAVARAENAAAHAADCAAFSSSRTVWWLALYEFAVVALAVAGVGWLAAAWTAVGVLSPAGFGAAVVHGAGAGGAAGVGGAGAVGAAVLSFLAAAVGGSVYSLYSLYVGALHRTLDRDALLWYVVKPITGGVMGAFVANIALFLAQSVTGGGLSTAHAGTGWLFYVLVAFFGGYNEKFAAQLTEIFASRVTGSAFLMRQASAKTAGNGGGVAGGGSGGTGGGPAKDA